MLVIGGLLGFGGNGNSDHFKDRHGLMIGFSSNFCLIKIDKKKNNIIDINYFIIFLQNIDVINFLLVFI